MTIAVDLGREAANKQTNILKFVSMIKTAFESIKNLFFSAF